jgi:hypothetical protein
MHFLYALRFLFDILKNKLWTHITVNWYRECYSFKIIVIGILGFIFN